eukprot:5701858-Lingulodinium_polyedra.AAC.1
MDAGYTGLLRGAITIRRPTRWPRSGAFARHAWLRPGPRSRSRGRMAPSSAQERLLGLSR